MVSDAYADEPANGHAWDLSRVPNYGSARAIEVVDGDTLSPERFRSFVAGNTPCLVKGASRRWPALERWRDPAYLRELCGHLQVRVRTSPAVSELQVGTRERDHRAREAETRARALAASVDFDDALAAITTDDDATVIVNLYQVRQEAHALAPVVADLGSFPFLPHAPKPVVFYPQRGVMFYKNSYSDWHFHPLAEALMCQVVGRKEVLLLPPDSHTWERLYPLISRSVAYYGYSAEAFPTLQELTPYRVVVEAGDALYIPVWWWHAVQAIGRHWGVTAPFWWDSPKRVSMDPRLPAVRRLIATRWQTNPFHTAAISPLLGVGMAWSIAANAARAGWSAFRPAGNEASP